MPTQGLPPKSFVTVGLNGGLNKKRDTHQLQNGELLTADNVVYSAVDGQVTKRFGYRQIQPQGAPFQGGPFKAIGCRDDIEPLVLGQNTLNRYNVAQNLSTAINTPTQGRLAVSQVAGSSGKTLFPWPPSHAHVAVDDQGKYACIVWEEPNSLGALIYYGIQDQTNGAWIVTPQLLPNFAPTIGVYTFVRSQQPQVNYANGNFFVSYLWEGIYGSNGSVQIVLGTLPLTNLAGGFTRNNFNFFIEGGTSTTYLTVTTPVSYDLHITGTRFAFVCTPYSQFQKIQTILGPVSGTTLTWGSTPLLALPPQGNNSTNTFNKLRVSCKANGAGQYPFVVATEVAIWTFTLSYSSSVYYVPGLSANAYFPGSPVDALWYGTAVNGNQLAFTTYGLDTATTTVPCMYLCLTDCSFSFFKQVQIMPPVGSWLIEQLSRIFVLPSGRLCVWVGAGSNANDNIYNNAYLMEVDPTQTVAGAKCIARAQYLSNYKLNYGDKTTPCEVFQVSGTQQYTTFFSSGTEKAGNPGGAQWRAYGVLNRVSFDYQPSRQVQIVSLPTGGNLIAGAYPLYYDGNEVVEAGFSAAPDYTTAPGGVGTFPANTGLPVPSSGGGSMDAATYSYLAVFVRRDSYGNVYRSAASSAISVTTTASGSSVYFPQYHYSGGGNTQIEYYRNTPTLAGQGTYYFVGQNPVVKPGDSFFNGFTDTNPDSQITSSRSWNLSETPNDPPPPVYHMALSDTRAYIIPSDNRNIVMCSKLFSPGRTVEWSVSQYVTEGQNAGLFTGLAVLDTNVIVFKADSICYFYGTGPDNSGANGSFSSLQKLATDVGCIDAASIKVIPDGVVFRSRRGIELLNRSLQIQYIGNNVEPLVQSLGDMSSVVLMPGYTELRFIPSTAGQPVLCYDYGQKRWSTFGMGATGLSTWASVQAVQILGQYWWLAADGSTVNIETPGAYLDATLPIIMTLETAEIPIGGAGTVGWGRVYRLGLLGDFYSQHRLNVFFQYDHQTSYTDQVVFDTTSGLVTGDSVYQFRCSRVPRQRMQTLRLKFQDSAVVGQSCAISTLVLEVGDKGGLARLPGVKTI